VTVASVGRRDHATHVELARRLCAAYVSFRMRRRGIDAVLRHVPKKIGHFWIELARLVTLQRRRSAPDENDKMPRDRYNARAPLNSLTRVTTQLSGQARAERQQKDSSREREASDLNTRAMATSCQCIRSHRDRRARGTPRPSRPHGS
jgi:hypothetical protein